MSQPTDFVPPTPAVADPAQPPATYVPQQETYPIPSFTVQPLTDVEQRVWASVGHGAGLILFWPALAARLVTRGRGQFGHVHATEALNFQITYLLSMLLCLALTPAVIGFFLLPLVAVPAVIFSIRGTVASGRGQMYKYPISIRFMS